MDLIRLVLYHSRIANAQIHDFRIANSEERGSHGTKEPLYTILEGSNVASTCQAMLIY